jgi:lipid-A-disaccharide synthase
MRIFFSVGEPSGDLHAANLIRDLRRLVPNVDCVGPRMVSAGFKAHFDLTTLAVMWIGQVVAHIGTFLRLRRDARKYFERERPDAVVLVDFPGFNWHIARAAKEAGIPVFYYGVPQLWAWLPWRVKKMQRWVDYALCKLPFEPEWFGQRGVKATFVGHPYFDEMERQTFDDSFLAEQRALPGRLLTLLPGSRTKEVEANLPAFLKAAHKISAQASDVRFAIAAFNEKQATLAERMVQEQGLAIPTFVGKTPELIHLAQACFACSGSVSLELLWHEKPAVVHYKVSRLLYEAGRRFLMTVRYATLVNILATDHAFDMSSREPYDRHSPLAGQVPYPEYVTCGDRSDDLAQHMIEWLTDEHSRQKNIAMLRDLKHRYAQPGASERAAHFIVEKLGQQAVSGLRAA